jgi:hypothetical protein
MYAFKNSRGVWLSLPMRSFHLVVIANDIRRTMLTFEQNSLLSNPYWLSSTVVHSQPPSSSCALLDILSTHALLHQMTVTSCGVCDESDSDRCISFSSKSAMQEYGQSISISSRSTDSCHDLHGLSSDNTGVGQMAQVASDGRFECYTRLCWCWQSNRLSGVPYHLRVQRAWLRSYLILLRMGMRCCTSQEDSGCAGHARSLPRVKSFTGRLEHRSTAFAEHLLVTTLWKPL